MPGKGPSLTNAAENFRTLVELLESGALGNIQAAPGVSDATVADVLGLLVPQSELEVAAEAAGGPAGQLGAKGLAALFGAGRRVMRSPFFHGTREDFIEDILSEGFRRGQSAELGIPGTSLSQDPGISSAFAEMVPQSLLGVDVQPKTLEKVRNLSPGDFLDIENVLRSDPSIRGVRKPQAFFRENETFMMRPREGIQPRIEPFVQPQDIPGVRARRNLKPAETKLLEKVNMEMDLIRRGISDLRNTNPVTITKGQIDNLLRQVTRTAARGGGNGDRIQQIRNILTVADEKLAEGTLMASPANARRLRVLARRNERIQRAARDIGQNFEDVRTLGRAADQLKRIQRSHRVTEVVETEDAADVFLSVRPSFRPGNMTVLNDVRIRIPRFNEMRMLVGNRNQPALYFEMIINHVDDFFRQANREADDLFKMIERGEFK